MANTFPLGLMVRQLLQRVLFLVVVAANAASAQGMGTSSCTVGPGFTCSLIEANEGRGPEQRHWLRALVIWKVGSGESSGIRDTAEARRSRQSYLREQRSAEDAGRALLGAAGISNLAAVTMTWGFRPNLPDSVFALGQAFELPRRDSALVLLIDARGGANELSPRLVATAWIPAGLDPGFWSKSWRSGDTTFIVSPQRGNRILQDSLAKAPAVRAFLSAPR